MTLNEIRSTIATYLKRDVDELIVNDVDMGLIAMNQVRMNAELNNDFEFTRKLLTVAVDGVTGGSLDDIKEYGHTGEDDPTYEIKTVLDVGSFDTTGNFFPANWTTVGDSLNQQRSDNRFRTLRYPTDAQAVCGPLGGSRFEFVGNKVIYFPVTTPLTITLGIEAYTFTADWVDTDFDDDNDARYNGPWNKQGSLYLTWQSIIHLNHVHKEFVFRQEGNLPPPEKLALDGLENLIRWDNFKYQQFRRHSR